MIKSIVPPLPLLRPSTLSDMDFLCQVYASTRFEETAMLIDWTDEQKEIFLRSQFLTQHGSYHQHYPDACYDVIESEDEKIGRFYVAYMESEIRIIDIALLPPFRSQGIGSVLITKVITEAEASQRFISLHVEDYNPAKNLYERMGFTVAGEVTFYKLMHWHPPTQTSSSNPFNETCT
ncbi:MAG: GNAT family N-acetyltransferase [Methylobacter sp.]